MRLPCSFASSLCASTHPNTARDGELFFRFESGFFIDRNAMSRQPKATQGDHKIQCFNYDFTFFGAGGVLPPTEEFIKLIRRVFKKWVFQRAAAPPRGLRTKAEDHSSKKAAA